MAGKAACRAFHVVSMAGNPWLGSLPPCKRSEQLFHLKWGSKSQVCSRKPAWQGARPDSTRRAARGDGLFSLRVFAMGWAEQSCCWHFAHHRFLECWEGTTRMPWCCAHVRSCFCLLWFGSTANGNSFQGTEFIPMLRY